MQADSSSRPGERRARAILVATAGVLIAAGVGWSGGCSAFTGSGGESLASQNLRKVPSWMKKEHLPPSVRPGMTLFAQIGCLNCHTYLGTGGGFKGAPDLSAEGRKHRGISWQIRHLRCPSCLVRGSPMPGFGALGTTRLKQIAAFLEASKGVK